jgi:hypothetical protein
MGSIMEPQQQPPMENAPTPAQSPTPEQPTGQPVETQPMAQPVAQPAMAQPMAAPAPTVQSEDPGKGMGIASLILGFFIPLAGLILGIIAKGKSKKAGHKNGLALAGIIVSIIAMFAQLAIGAIMVVGLLAISAKCKDLGPGTHYDNGTTFTCS